MEKISELSVAAANNRIATFLTYCVWLLLIASNCYPAAAQNQSGSKPVTLMGGSTPPLEAIKPTPTPITILDKLPSELVPNKTYYYWAPNHTVISCTNVVHGYTHGLVCDPASPEIQKLAAKHAVQGTNSTTQSPKP